MFPRFVCKLVLIFAFPICLMGQSVDDSLQARLLNKQLYLRGFWQNDKLRFDAAGKLHGKSNVFPFTLSGIEITSVVLKPKGLELAGRRIGLMFNKITDPPQRVVLRIGPADDKHDEQMHIEIDSPANGEYGSALDMIFTDDLASLVPTLPPEWQNYASKHLVRDAAPFNPDSELPGPHPGVKKIGGGVTPPVLLDSVDPEFRKYGFARIKGASTINLVVDQSGKPTQLSVFRPLGLGFDEAALRAIQKYRFKPAMEGGSPVAVDLNVHIEFDYSSY